MEEHHFPLKLFFGLASPLEFAPAIYTSAYNYVLEFFVQPRKTSEKILFQRYSDAQCELNKER